MQAVLLSRAVSARNGKCGAHGMCRGIPAVLLRTTGRDLPWLCVRRGVSSAPRLLQEPGRTGKPWATKGAL